MKCPKGFLILTKTLKPYCRPTHSLSSRLYFFHSKMKNKMARKNVTDNSFFHSLYQKYKHFLPETEFSVSFKEKNTIFCCCFGIRQWNGMVGNLIRLIVIHWLWLSKPKQNFWPILRIDNNNFSNLFSFQIDSVWIFFFVVARFRYRIVISDRSIES